MRTLLVLLMFLIASCASIDWKEKTVQDITAKTTRNNHVRLLLNLESKVLALLVESARWYLSSGLNYRSSYSLNVHLLPKVVSQFSQKYNLKNALELIGKRIRVKGTAIAKPYCVKFGCPLRVNLSTPEMYLQTQLLITNLDNISLP